MDDHPSAPHPVNEHSAGAWLLLATSAILSALILTLASMRSSDASLHWQRALQDEQKRGGFTLEEVRFVFQDIANASLARTTATIRAEEYEFAAAAIGNDPGLGAEAQAQKSEADLLASLYPDVLVDANRFEREGAALLAERLADEEAGSPEILALDPDHEQGLGDDQSRTSILLLLAVLPAATAFLMATLAQAFRRRRALLSVGWALVAAAAGATLIEALA
jgi:hypothetical protein